MVSFTGRRLLFDGYREFGMLFTTIVDYRIDLKGVGKRLECGHPLYSGSMIELRLFMGRKEQPQMYMLLHSLYTLAQPKNI
jgi:hypothetical protein